MEAKFITRILLSIFLLNFISTNFCIVLTYADDYQSSPASKSSYLSKKTLSKINSSLSKSGISSLPSSSSIVSSSSSSSSFSVDPFAVSGTPPTLKEIAALPTIKNLFWRLGIIDAIASTPTVPQCGEYFYGMQDGLSGGQAACRMAENVGFSFQSILDGALSVCYMQKFPTAENLSSGGITLVSGKFPNNDVTKVFSIPKNKNRIVKVNMSDSNGDKLIFVKINSQSKNKSKGDFYKATLWFCNPNTLQPDGFNIFDIGDNGLFKSITSHNKGGGDKFTSTLKGYLKGTGTLSFNENFERTALFEREEGGGGNFKSLIKVKGNYITTKSFDTIGNFTNKSYVKAEISGTDFDDLKFLQGAFKNFRSKPGNGEESFTGASEWRTLSYLSSPQNSLIQDVDDFEIDNDDFFLTEGNVDINLTKYSCTTTPDIEVNVDNENSTVAAAIADCSGLQVQGMHFCHDDTQVQNAEQNFFNVCPHP